MARMCLLGADPGSQRRGAARARAALRQTGAAALLERALALGVPLSASRSAAPRSARPAPPLSAAPAAADRLHLSNPPPSVRGEQHELRGAARGDQPRPCAGRRSVAFRRPPPTAQQARARAHTHTRARVRRGRTLMSGDTRRPSPPRGAIASPLLTRSPLPRPAGRPVRRAATRAAPRGPPPLSARAERGEREVRRSRSPAARRPRGAHAAGGRTGAQRRRRQTGDPEAAIHSFFFNSARAISQRARRRRVVLRRAWNSRLAAAPQMTCEWRPPTQRVTGCTAWRANEGQWVRYAKCDAKIKSIGWLLVGLAWGARVWGGGGRRATTRRANARGRAPLAHTARAACGARGDNPRAGQAPCLLGCIERMCRFRS